MLIFKVLFQPMITQSYPICIPIWNCTQSYYQNTDNLSEFGENRDNNNMQDCFVYTRCYSAGICFYASSGLSVGGNLVWRTLLWKVHCGSKSRSGYGLSVRC